jgi:hypothetical protein
MAGPIVTAPEDGCTVTTCEAGTVSGEHVPDTDDLNVAPPFKAGHALNVTAPSKDAEDENVAGPPSVTLPVLVLTNVPLSVAVPDPDVVIVPTIDNAGPIVPPEESATEKVTPLGTVTLAHDVPDAQPARKVTVDPAAIAGHA